MDILFFSIIFFFIGFIIGWKLFFLWCIISIVLVIIGINLLTKYVFMELEGIIPFIWGICCIAGIIFANILWGLIYNKLGVISDVFHWIF